MTGDWRLHAACRGMDTALFFLERGSMDHQAAKRVCAHCPVADACLDHAMNARHHHGGPVDLYTIGEHHGIWGGLSERERRRLRRERALRRQAAAVSASA